MNAAEFGLKRWRSDRLDGRAGRLALPDAVIDELDATRRYVRENPLPILAVDTRDFVLDATKKLGRTIRTELESGYGFVLVNRLPLEGWTRDESIAAYWLLSSCIARPVSQSWDGKLVYDVRDRGRPPGNGVRPDVTNAGQNYHTDNSYNDRPPHVVGLLCLQTAKRGGTSGVVSFAWAHSEMRRRHPEHLERLYQPYYFDRQHEHADNEHRITHHPLFERAGDRLIARLSYRHVMSGHRMAGVELDEPGRVALDTFESILNEPGVGTTFEFEPGQIQYVNNLALGHRRTAFEDFPEPERKRHLVRLWLRDTGRRGYGG